MIKGCLLFSGCDQTITQSIAVYFELGGEKIKVQKDYFRGGGENKWGMLMYADFWVLLPNFETYEKTKNQYEFVDRLGWGRKLYISFHARKASRDSVPEIIEHLKDRVRLASFSGRLDNPDEMKYGLEVYYGKSKLDDTYLHGVGGDEPVYITCVENVPSPGCKMRWDYSKNVYADTSFNMKHLPQWQENISNVQKVINGQNIQGD